MNRMAGITVREVGAKQLLEEIGVEVPITVTADPALLLTPDRFTDEMLMQAGIPRDRRLVGLSVRERGAAAPHLEGSGNPPRLAQPAHSIRPRTDARGVFCPLKMEE